MLELLAVAVITLLAVISPGADFAMVTRNSLLYGRSAGLCASVGIAIGVQLHVFYTMLGVGLLIRNSPEWFVAIKLAGAAYLVYVGYKTFASGPALNAGCGTSLGTSTGLGTLGALRSGFLTNALNPKTTLFVLSVYTQVVRPDTPLSVQLGYGLFMSLAHWAWFSLVTLFFSEAHLRAGMLKRQIVVNRSIGAVLIALGLSLALAPVAIP